MKCCVSPGRQQQPLRCWQAAGWDLLLDFIDPASKDRLDPCDRGRRGFKALCALRIRKSSHLTPSDRANSCNRPFFLSGRDEAEMEYLKIAQDLEMYGVNYFAIRVSAAWGSRFQGAQGSLLG